MEENKTEIVEKRLSRGVIRRRSRQVVQKEPVREAQPLPRQEPVQKQVMKQPAEVSEKETLSKEKALVLDQGQKSQAQKNVSENLRLKDEAEKPVEHPGSLKILQERIIQKPDKEKKEPPKEEKPRILSFKDRVKGTIDLAQFKKGAGKEQESDAVTQKRLAGHAGADDEEGKPKAAKARQKKSVKAIGGDLDIEGAGRVTHLTQIVRTSAMDRVFQPGAVKGRGRKKKIVSKKHVRQTALTTKKASKRVIEIDQGITVGRLAQKLGTKASNIIKKLMELNVMATMNQAIDRDTAAVIASEYDHEVRDVSFKEEKILNQTRAAEKSEKTAQPLRPPVVTVMGHVDHGKTSLLDAIRATNVTEQEAGGITQHIGAYTVSLSQGNVTFLDTPGHEAFTTMRSRGAKATDIVVLVVAADDGVMPQTIESIDHARAAGVPIIVAVNKIDKEDAKPDVVKRQLSEKGLVSEEWGGEVIFNEVSAKKKQGIKELLESILLQAEMMELKADPNVPAEGVVLEGKLDRARGAMCTFLVQSGTLRVGDAVVAGVTAGRVRNMTDWEGNFLKEAGPSLAVEVMGLSQVPEAGDVFHVVSSEQDAQKITQHRLEKKQKGAQGKAAGGVTLEEMFSKMQKGEANELNLILKTDVQGSLEALRDAIAKIGNEEVQAKIIHASVGGVTESDIRLALTTNSVIIGFNVRPETNAIHLAKEHKIEVKLYKVIYDLVNDVRLAMQGLLAPEIRENYLGRAEVRQTFEVSKVGLVAGCMVADGVITRNAHIRLLRDNVVQFEGKITSLKRFKDDARDVKQGSECGVGVEGNRDIRAGDVIEAYDLVEIKKTL